MMVVAFPVAMLVCVTGAIPLNGTSEFEDYHLNKPQMYMLRWFDFTIVPTYCCSSTSDDDIFIVSATLRQIEIARYALKFKPSCY